MKPALLLLLAAGAVSGSPSLGSFGPGMALANELLITGERETVIAYLEACLKLQHRLLNGGMRGLSPH